MFPDSACSINIATINVNLLPPESKWACLTRTDALESGLAALMEATLNAFWKRYGIMRSILMYYAKPFAKQRMMGFYRSFVQPGDLCFDVGAHVGSRTRVFLALGARVVAIEPQPDFMKLLQRWYGANPNVTLVDAALGAASGHAEMRISQRTPTVTTLSTEWIDQVTAVPSFAWVEWDQAQTVKVTTLDTLIAENGEPAFCKIDVEGYELEVLRGLSRPIRALSFEYIPAARDLAVHCAEHIATMGDYRFNWALGESLQLQQEWHNADQLTAYLRQLPPDARSGDIYARLPH
jgi:FkbM family methyltransferase